MSKKPTVSIVIPACDEADSLPSCLESIAAQTVMPLEVIVVDNGSTDRTAEIAGSFGFVRVIRQSERGLIKARNAGFDAAKSEIIGRIDADVLLPRGWVEHIQEFYARPSATNRMWAGCGNFYNVFPAGLVDWSYRLMAFHFNRLLLGHGSLWGSNMAMTRRQWRAARTAVCHSGSIHEDLDLAVHAAKHGYDIVYDFSMPVAAEMRRVYAGRQELWDYLQLWPNTLRAHGKKSWIVCWIFGALMLYLATFVLMFLGTLPRNAWLFSLPKASGERIRSS